MDGWAYGHRLDSVYATTGTGEGYISCGCVIEVEATEGVNTCRSTRKWGEVSRRFGAFRRRGVGGRIAAGPADTQVTTSSIHRVGVGIG